MIDIRRRFSPAVLLWLLSGFFIFYGTGLPIELAMTRAFLAGKVAAINWIPFAGYEGRASFVGDVVQNLLLFLPPGFFGYFALSRSKRRSLALRCSIVSLSGALLSAGVETVQLFTLERVTSVTDLVNNTLGTFCGFWAGAAALRFVRPLLLGPRSLRFFEARSAYPALLSMAYLLADRLQPFRFTLDPKSVRPKLWDLAAHPLTSPGDFSTEGFAFLPCALCAGLLALLLKELGARRPLVIAFMTSAAAGLMFEGAQVFVYARMPGAQDALTILCACACGALCGRFLTVNSASRPWLAPVILLTAVSAVLDTLSPFTAAGAYRGFNWIPFVAYYEKTSFVALRNFTQMVLLFLPLGFAARQVIARPRRAYAAALMLTAAIALPLEYAQGWVMQTVLDKPDVTDVIGALAGGLLGAAACGTGWRWYRAYVRDMRGRLPA